MDWTTILVAGLAFAGTAVGSLAGVRVSNRLVEHRLEELEKKVDKHNNLVERMTRVETKLESIGEV